MEMAQRVCIIGAGVVGLATAHALVLEGFDVTVLEARDAAGLETSFANGGQLSYRYVAPLADAGVPQQALGWLLRGDSPARRSTGAGRSPASSTGSGTSATRSQAGQRTGG